MTCSAMMMSLPSAVNALKRMKPVASLGTRITPTQTFVFPRASLVFVLADRLTLPTFL